MVKFTLGGVPIVMRIKRDGDRAVVCLYVLTPAGAVSFQSAPVEISGAEIGADIKGMMRWVAQVKAHKNDPKWFAAQLRADGFDPSKPESFKAWAAHKRDSFGFRKSSGFLGDLGHAMSPLLKVVAVAAPLLTPVLGPGAIALAAGAAALSKAVKGDAKGALSEALKAAPVPNAGNVGPLLSAGAKAGLRGALASRRAPGELPTKRGAQLSRLRGAALGAPQTRGARIDAARRGASSAAPRAAEIHDAAKQVFYLTLSPG